MKKNIIYLGFIVLVLCIIISGCTELQSEKHDDSDNNLFDEPEKNENGTEDEPKNEETNKDSDGDGYYDFEDAFPFDSSEWFDGDGDGYGDNSDAFPNDSSEWVDSDQDGMGDNSDFYPFDYDNDGYADSVDINKYEDVAIRISLEKFEVVDELDFLFTSVEVFFEIYIEDRLEARIDSYGLSWKATVDEIYKIDDCFLYNIEDDQRYTDIRVVMWDDDFIPLTHDIIDIDGSDDSGGLSIVFDAFTGTWSGDDTDGVADGREDGSWYYDDDDGILWYDIDLVEVEYNKTYVWSYDFISWYLDVSIPRESYAYYRHSQTNRFPLFDYQRAAFVTSDDTVVKDIANRLYDIAEKENFDYYETVNFILRFVQRLEYTHDNVTTTRNEYWRFAVETLVDETGDCEDTSILFASLMEALGYDAVLIKLPNHIAVGISGSEGYPGSYYSYDGQGYYYCETTGEGYTMGLLPSEFIGESATIIQVE